jgi:hypothetical protein
MFLIFALLPLDRGTAFNQLSTATVLTSRSECGPQLRIPGHVNTRFRGDVNKDSGRM